MGWYFTLTLAVSVIQLRCSSALYPSYLQGKPTNWMSWMQQVIAKRPGTKLFLPARGVWQTCARNLTVLPAYLLGSSMQSIYHTPKNSAGMSMTSALTSKGSGSGMSS